MGLKVIKVLSPRYSKRGFSPVRIDTLEITKEDESKIIVDSGWTKPATEHGSGHKW